MLTTTREAVSAVLKADPSLTPTDRTRILAACREHGRERTPKTPPRILRRAEVAERLGRSKRFVDLLAVQGILPKVTLPGRKRAVGFPSEAVEKLLTAGE